MTTTADKIKLNIGPYQIHAMPTGVFGLDGGAMFGTVPKVLWEKSNPPDSQNRIPMEARGLLLRSPGQNILIDTGNGSDFVAKYGPKLGPKFSEIYNVNENGIIKSLALHNLTPEDIHAVILTHLHFDHAGGGTTERNGKIVPTFPNAKYFVQKSNLQTASHPNLREKASYFAANFQPLIDANVLTLLDGPQQNVFPGVHVQVSNGHTLGHQMVIVESESSGLVYCGDVVPTSSHVRSAWIMGYDLNPLLIIEEKQKILKTCAEKNWYTFFEHDPYCDLAQIEYENNDFKVKSRYFLD